MSELGPTLTSSDRTATDELRRLLDERGVEYVLDDEYAEEYPPEQRVTWSSDIAGEDMTVTARDYCININDDGSADYCLDLEFHEVFTPEQAVAATLGSEEAYTREDVEGAFVSGYSLGSLPVGSDPRWDENSQTVDEHMAELGWVRAATLGDTDATAMRQGDAAHDLMAPCDWRDGTLFLVLPEDPERIGVRLFPSRHAPSRMYVPMAEAAQIKDENAELQERVKEQGRTIRAYHNECDELRELVLDYFNAPCLECNPWAEGWEGCKHCESGNCTLATRTLELGIEVDE